MQESRKIDLVWNVTRLCPWDCTICCVDAIQAKSFPWHDTVDSLERSNTELTLEKKLQILKNLREFDCKIDISGGDPLGHPHTWVVLQQASSLFGQSNITLTATGATLARSNLEDLLPLVGELNFTYDFPLSRANDYRPIRYAKGNLVNAAKLCRGGLSVRAECPLTRHNTDGTTLEELYTDLNHYGIGELLVMRMFPVGRGMLEPGLMLSAGDYERAIYDLRDLEERYGIPKVKLQCALKMLDQKADLTTNPCDLVHVSFGLMPNGTLLASPWAYGLNGKPLGSEWVLGDLAKESLESILSSPKTVYYKQHLNENFGHCKVFAWCFSHNPDGLQGIFDKADPVVNGRTSFLQVINRGERRSSSHSCAVSV